MSSSRSYSEYQGVPMPGKVSPSRLEMEFVNNGEAVSDKKRQNGSHEEEPEKDEKKKKKEKEPMVGFCELFKFASCLDVFLMIFGSVCAAGHGCSLPAMIIVFGDMIDLFINSGKMQDLINAISDLLPQLGITSSDIMNNPSLLVKYKDNIFNHTNGTIDIDKLNQDTSDNILNLMEEYAIYYVIIGCAVLVLGYVQVAFWTAAAERQSYKIRLKLFKNILRQEIGWFDTHESGELNNRLSDDILKIQEGMGDKMGNFAQWFSSFLAGFIIGFYYGWKLTLVILAVSPLLAFSAIFFSKLMAEMTTKELKAYAKAGAIAEEVFSSVKTVMAFSGQEKESQRYSENLLEAKNFGIKKGFSNGMTMGVVWLVVFGAYALGFWYGGKLVRDEPENYTPGGVLIVFFSVLIGAFSLGHASPSLQSLAAGRGAAYIVYKLIDLVPEIDSSSPQGKTPSSIVGNLKFRNVNFCYPSREEVQVMNNVNFDVNVGQTVALVGPSGCGKSTSVQLIQRFYDPTQGEIYLDDNNIRELNVKWLRQHIGIVSQEPVLFATTIKENIRYGFEDVTDQQIVAACKMANAHDFISALPEKYSTLVGERGAQLSGGQKQRIAIARALVRDPKILLLDEATSALDTESEAVVQSALDKARAGRTTIVIAHRLSTIKTADVIIGIQEGKVVEKGSHDELMQQNGLYYQLVTAQMNRTEEDEEFEDLSDEEPAKDEIEDFEKGLLKRSLSNRPSLKRLKSVGSETASPMKRAMSISEEKKEEEEIKKLPKPSMMRIFRLNSSEWPFILLGCVASLINGGVQPAFAIIFAEILGVFSKDNDTMKDEIAMYAGVLVAIGAASCITMFLQGYMFGKSGECLTLRIRQMTFRAMLQQEVAWFDDPKNATGALTTRLATDASQVQGAAGVKFGMLIQNIANMGTALVIAFVFGWKLTLVILAFLPFIAVAGWVQMKMLGGVAGKNKEALEAAGKVSTESIENIRTVASLSKEDTFYKLYVSEVDIPHKQALRKAHVVGLTFSASQAILFFAYAASFYFGAYLIKEGEMDYVDVFRVFSAIVFGAMALGQTNSFAPDASKAAVSASKIFELFDRIPVIDSDSSEGETPAQEQFTSQVTFEGVEFTYPNRPDTKILKGLNIKVEPGQTLALVGSSGCGKSTTVSLIERFYDVDAGSVKLDAYDVKNLNIKWLRAQIGIVSQEPILFDRSIAENIAYGDNTRVVTMSEIIEAAKGANIHSFISSLPMGYETNCGEKGTQLSGGQKQRVAIARALIRNPKILLLDEATSALDTESEKVVQEALDKASQGRTCIVIAHRLSTIQGADKIVVIKGGQVIEEGTHSELLSQQGFYYKLQNTQKRHK